MADIPATLRAWSATAASNQPTDSTTIGSGLDDNLRVLQSVVRQFLGSYGSNIASAATMDLSTMDAYVASVTGNTTVTGLGTEAAGISYWLVTASTPMFKNSATLITGADITAAAGDIFRFTSEGSGTWRLTNFISASGYTGTGALVRAASPTLTGTPLAPTAAVGTSTTQIATTAYVLAISSPTIQVYTTAGSNTWIKPSNLKHVIVEVLGAGGPGGSANSSGGTSSGGGGGGAGAFVRKYITTASLAGTVTATVGASSTAGGLSAFQGHCTAPGGAAGSNGGADTFGAGGAGGIGVNGDINGTGATGFPALGTASAPVCGGHGASTDLGGGGIAPRSSANGGAATGKGAGGGGALDTSGNNRTGGAGSDGMVVVWEFYT